MTSRIESVTNLLELETKLQTLKENLAAIKSSYLDSGTIEISLETSDFIEKGGS